MKRIVSYFLLSALAFVQLSGFNRTRLSEGWRFSLGDEAQWASPSYDDSAWRQVTLPHDWSIEGSFSKENPSGYDGAYLPTGTGWYRLHLRQPKQTSNVPLQTKLYFEGIYMNSTVYLNGDSIGGHPYGYSSFWVDVTGRLQEGENTLAIRVDNSAQKNCRWYTGSGIYRHVWLCQLNPDQMDDPWKLYLRTGQIYGISADGNRADSATLCIEYDGKPVETRTFRDVRLWSPSQPALYTIEVGGLTVEHGFREISYSTSGFRLNGQEMLLFGGCVHHDHGCIGTASYDAAEWRKAQQLKEAGYNAVRTAHNPASEEFIRACDHLGLLVIEEAFDGLRAKKNAHDYHKLIDRWWRQDVDAMVLRDRNHPSIIAWSNGNEVWERKKIEIITTSRNLARRMRQLDPSRPVTQALCEVDSIFDPLAETLDVVGYNYLIQHAARDHARCPERIIWQTESYADSAFQSWEAAQDLPYVIGDFVWTSIDYLGESGIGRAHYASDPADRGEHWQGSKWPWHGSYCGDIDLTGLRKPISFYRQCLWDTVPNIYIGVREPNCYVDSIICTLWSTWPTTQSWNWPGHEGKPIEVEVYSRYPRVRLYLNDQPVGEEATSRNERYKATFTLPYQPGLLRAVGILEDGSEGKSQVIRTAGKAAAIRLTASQSTLKSDGQDLSFVTIELVDAQGTPLPMADDRLSIRLQGDGTLLGVGNAYPCDMDSYAGHLAKGCNQTDRKLWHGRAIAVVRSGKRPGRLSLTVAGAGISRTISLRTVR